MLTRLPMDVQERVFSFLPILGSLPLRPVCHHIKNIWESRIEENPCLYLDWKTLLSLQKITALLELHLREKIAERIELSSCLLGKTTTTTTHYLSTVRINQWETKRSNLGALIRFLHLKIHRMQLKRLQTICRMNRRHRKTFHL